MIVSSFEVFPDPHIAVFAHQETLQVIHQQLPKKHLLASFLDVHEESMRAIDEE
jgi:hypothetical protein